MTATMGRRKKCGLSTGKGACMQRSENGHESFLSDASRPVTSFFEYGYTYCYDNVFCRRLLCCCSSIYVKLKTLGFKT